MEAISNKSLLYSGRVIESIPFDFDQPSLARRVIGGHFLRCRVYDRPYVVH
jgi:hypothetical protein